MPPPYRTGAPTPPGQPPRPGEGRAGQFDLFGRPTKPAAPTLRVQTVSELTRDLKGTVEARFARVGVRGEISNYKPAGSGHLYFTLKDDGACISAVMFRADAMRLKFPLKDGMAVVARGRLSVYEPRGQYQLICEALEPEGAGALALAFEALKKKLHAEGLFEASRKRKIPFLAKRVGLVTSPSGAAIRDFLRVLHDRFPFPVLLAPARVQGEGSAEEIARAIARLAASGLVDVIVVTRGGGSIEDLWAFNEEVVARAIAACPVPVISAVGHEVDVTIADFVADLRCATPTDAAKTLAPPKEDLLRALEKHRRHLREILLRHLSLRRERLAHRRARLTDPRTVIANGRLRLDDAENRMRHALARRATERRQTLAAFAERLERGHPRARLARLERELVSLRERLVSALRRRLQNEAESLRRLSKTLAAKSPQPRIQQRHRDLARLRERAEKAAHRRLSTERLRFSRAAAGIDSLSPLKVLGRGYAVAFLENGHVAMSADKLAPGDALRVMLPDQSEVDTRVSATRPKAR